MPKYGLMIDYEFCVGCHTCELSCKQEYNRPPEEWGIRIMEIEPEVSGGKEYFILFPTDKCNLCGKRVAKGLQPACVQNCWAGVMKFGLIEQLSEDMKNKARTVLWVPH
jgi:Fe-S-cluster-containing dehydrogenase component